MNAHQLGQIRTAAHSLGRTIASALVLIGLVAGLLCLLAGLVFEIDLALIPADQRVGLFLAMEAVFVITVLIAGLVILWATVALLRWGFSPQWPLLIHRLSLCIGVVALLTGVAAPFAGLEWASWIISLGALGLAGFIWGPNLARFRARRMRRRSEPAPTEADADESIWSTPTTAAVRGPTASSRPARPLAGLVAAVCLLILGLLLAIGVYMNTLDGGHRPAEPEAQIGAAAGDAITMTVCPILAVICLGTGWLILRRFCFSARNLSDRTPTSSSQ